MLNEIRENFNRLWESQQIAVRYYLQHSRAIDRSDTGVGKTYPPIVAADFLLHQGAIESVLVLHEKNTAEKWEKSIRDWSVYHSRYIHTNYEQVKKRFRELAVYSRSKGMVVLDECDTIANPLSVRSKWVSRLLSHYSRRILLTATLERTNITFFWFPLWCMDPVKYKSYYKFVLEYCQKKLVTIKRKQRGRWIRETIITPGEPIRERIPELQKELDKYCYYVPFHKAHPDIPEPVIQELYIDMTAEEKALYKKIWDEWEELEEKSIRLKPGQLFSLQSACLRFTSYPRAVFPDFKGKMAKGGTIFPIIETQVRQGKQILVIASYTETLSMLKRELRRRTISCITLRGKHTEHAEERIAAFKSGAYQVMLLQARLASGLDMENASILIFWDRTYFDRPWKQGIGRIVRPGQKDLPKILVPIYRGTMDIAVKERIDEREKLPCSLLRKPKMLRQAFFGEIELKGGKDGAGPVAADPKIEKIRRQMQYGK